MPICKILPLSQLCFSLGVAKAYNSSAAAKWWSNMEQPKILKAGWTDNAVEYCGVSKPFFHLFSLQALFVQLLHQIRFTHLRALKWVEIVSCRRRFRAGWLNSRTELQCSVLLTIHTVEIRDVFRSFQSSAMCMMCMRARVILEATATKYTSLRHGGRKILNKLPRSNSLRMPLNTSDNGGH